MVRDARYVELSGAVPTIPDLDLDLGIALGHVLDRSRDFAHVGDGGLEEAQARWLSLGRSCREARSQQEECCGLEI